MVVLFIAFKGAKQSRTPLLEMGTAQSKKDTIVGNTKTPPIEQFVTPTGLYPTTNNWDLRVIKKLVLSKKIAPLYQGKEKQKETDFPNHEECPICFLVLFNSA